MEMQEITADWWGHFCQFVSKSRRYCKVFITVDLCRYKISQNKTLQGTDGGRGKISEQKSLGADINVPAIRERKCVIFPLETNPVLSQKP